MKQKYISKAKIKIEKQLGKLEDLEKQTDDLIKEAENMEENDITLPAKDLFRIDEVANYFSVTDQTIRLWIDHGHFEIEKLHGSIRVLRRSIVSFRLKSKPRLI